MFGLWTGHGRWLENMKMESQEQTTNFEILPTEIKIMIFSHLQVEHKKTSRLVCKEWFKIVSCLTKSNVILNDETLEFVKKCSVRQVETLQIVNLKTNKFILSPSRKGNLPEGRFLHLQSGNSKENILKILRYYCRNVERLTLDNLSLENMNALNISTVIPKIDWAVLKHLRLEIQELTTTDWVWRSYGHRHHIDMLAKFLEELNAPNLQEITLNFKNPEAIFRFGETPFLPSFNNIYKAFYKCLCQHYESLIVVSAHLRGRQFHVKDDLLQIRSKLAQLQLQTLNLNFDIENIDIALNICCAGNRLKKFVYKKTFSILNRVVSYPQIFSETMNRNKETIETLTLGRIVFDGCLLNGFDKLRHLDIVAWNPQNMENAPVLPSLTSLTWDCGFMYPTLDTSLVVVLHQILFWISNRMPNLEKLYINFNSHYLMTKYNLHDLLKIPKLQKLCVSRVDKESFTKYCIENNIPNRDYVFYYGSDLMKQIYFQFKMSRALSGRY